MSADSGFTPSALSRSLSRSFALHSAARAVEALSLGWLAAAIVLALVTLTTAGERGAQAWIAACIAGSAAAASLWIERTPRVHEHVRRVDRRLGLNGALVTAGEVSASATPDSPAGALVARVGAHIETSALARAALPSTPLALVALLLGTTVLFAARDLAARQRGEGRVVVTTTDASARAAVLGQAAAALRSAAARARATGGAGARAAGTRADLAQALERAAETPAGQTGEDALHLEDLAHVLATSSLRASERTAVARAATLLAAEQPRNRATELPPQVSAHRSETGAHPSGPSKAAGIATGRSEAPGTGSLSDPEPEPASGSLASVEASGRMVAPQPRGSDSSAPSGRSAAALAPERGVGALRWWPARDDAVVEAWVQSMNNNEQH